MHSFFAGGIVGFTVAYVTGFGVDTWQWWVLFLVPLTVFKLENFLK